MYTFLTPDECILVQATFIACVIIKDSVTHVDL